MTERERQILALIKDDPMISQRALAEKLDITRSAVAGHIMRLTTKGYIRGRGYVVEATPATVVIGGASMDVHGQPLAALRMRDSNPGKAHTSPGGVARNIAENLARLGTSVALISAVGNDHYGDYLITHGRKAGINMQSVPVYDSASTATYLSIQDEDGDMLAALADMSVLEQLDAATLDEQRRAIEHAPLIIIDTNLSEEAIGYVTNTCATQPIFVNTVSTTKAKRVLPFLDSIHSLFPSLSEAEAMSGMRGSTARQRKAMCAWFHDQGVARVFITLGRHGVTYSVDGGQQGTVESLHRSALVNANGAGDAFTAGVASAWLANDSLEHAIDIGLAAASLTLSDPATVSPSMSSASVRRLLEQRDVA